MKCSGENQILRGIFHEVSRFPLHFISYRGNFDYFLDSVVLEWSHLVWKFCSYTAVGPQESQRQGMVTALDDAVANVTAALRRTGLYRDSLIVFLSDNGGAERGSNWPLRGKKNSIYEGGTRTVAFVHGPRWVRPSQRGSVSRGLVHLVDWYPTLLALAGGACDAGNNNNSESADNDLHGAAEKKREEDGPAGDLPRRPLDGMNQAEHLLAGESAPRTELIYNINDALRVTAAIRYTAQADSDGNIC